MCPFLFLYIPAASDLIFQLLDQKHLICFWHLNIYLNSKSSICYSTNLRSENSSLPLLPPEATFLWIKPRPLLIPILKPRSQVPCNVTLLANRAFKDGKIKLRPLDWALIQSVWCPYKRRRLGHRETPGIHEHRGKKKILRRHSLKVAIYKPRRKASEEIKSANTLILHI